MNQHEILDLRIDEILCYVWDPIGVSNNGFPEARDEYSSYVPMISNAIRDGANENQIIQLLEEIRIKTIGCSPDPKNDKDTSDAIFAWVERLNGIV